MVRYLAWLEALPSVRALVCKPRILLQRTVPYSACGSVALGLYWYSRSIFALSSAHFYLVASMAALPQDTAPVCWAQLPDSLHLLSTVCSHAGEISPYMRESLCREPAADGVALFSAPARSVNYPYAQQPYAWGYTWVTASFRRPRILLDTSLSS
ncbi:hypothetical protein K438DRAFT_1792834 [Mycena galopus ATCC 62051]|nr:hypothetical protein K438DRAFT_1792834 [Mycena galopus ATCC 62051]